ncbi:MAG: 16S rRNA (guanine(527)-N(7))-methyltransferase RsmG [Acholeplasmataceae bacterium]|nr:16S rRNA (guanine(527)-N(7))-methyltransferase RsmG [Acholeplasmataceae bacterium]
MNFETDIRNYFSIELSPKQVHQFHQYYQFLIEYNLNVNLTAITEQNEVYYKHFFDSLTAVKFIDFDKVNSICDMGSGAGFPSIPLKIIFPHLEVTIIDSLNKRLKFLEQLMDKLEINQVNLVHDRIENYAIKHQCEFDLVTARALGDLSLISEMGLPMTKINGSFIAYKGSNSNDEIEKSTEGIHKLGGKIDIVRAFELPYGYGDRTIIKIIKIKNIKGFPRSFQLMKKKPL